MRKLDLSYLLSLDIRKTAISLDEEKLKELDLAIKKLVDFRCEVMEVRKQAGGTLPDGGLLVVGSAAFHSLNISTQCVVYELNVLRRRRKSK